MTGRSDERADAPDPARLELGGGPVGWRAISRAGEAIGLPLDPFADLRRATLPCLLAAAFDVPGHALGHDAVGIILACVGRDLRLLATALRRAPGRRRTGLLRANRLQHHRDVRTALRIAARRTEVAAELHRRLLIGLALDHTAERERLAQSLAAARIERAEQRAQAAEHHVARMEQEKREGGGA